MSEKRPETDREILTRSQQLELPVSEFSSARSFKSKTYSIDLPTHMAECDVNYHKLQKLFQNMRLEDECLLRILFSERVFNISLAVQDRGPYTTTVRISQIAETDDWVLIPNIAVRVYHDAKSAEVIKVGNQKVFHGVYEYPNRKMRQPDEKEQINKFFGEVLSLCIENGIGADLFAKT